MDFLSFANFCLVSCKGFESGKGWSLIQVTSRGGPPPKITSGSLLLVGVEPNPMVVSPPVLLYLLLLLLHVVDPLACVLLPVLG